MISIGDKVSVDDLKKLRLEKIDGPGKSEMVYSRGNGKIPEGFYDAGTGYYYGSSAQVREIAEGVFR